MVLFILLYKVILTFESVDDFLKCDRSNESYIERYFRVVLEIHELWTHVKVKYAICITIK